MTEADIHKAREKIGAYIDDTEIDSAAIPEVSPNDSVFSSLTGNRKDILDILLDYPTVFREGVANLYFYVKELPSKETNLKSMPHQLKRWDDTHHKGFGPIYESIWYQGWRAHASAGKEKIVIGLSVKIRFVTVPGHLTLSKVEKRIDKAIQPAKEYLSTKDVGPSAEPGADWWKECVLCKKLQGEEYFTMGVCPDCYDRL